MTQFSSCIFRESLSSGGGGWDDDKMMKMKMMLIDFFGRTLHRSPAFEPHLPARYQHVDI